MKQYSLRSLGSLPASWAEGSEALKVYRFQKTMPRRIHPLASLILSRLGHLGCLVLAIKPKVRCPLGPSAILKTQTIAFEPDLILILKWMTWAKVCGPKITQRTIRNALLSPRLLFYFSARRVSTASYNCLFMDLWNLTFYSGYSH